VIEQLKKILLAADIMMSFIFYYHGHRVWRRHVLLAQKILM